MDIIGHGYLTLIKERIIIKIITLFWVTNQPITRVVGADWLGECLLFETQIGHALSEFCVPYILKYQKKTFRVPMHSLVAIKFYQRKSYKKYKNGTNSNSDK